MVASKSTSKRKPGKLRLTRETLKDLGVRGKAKDVKGGSIVNCATRRPDTQQTR